jgi:hypothetical protein
MKNLDQPKKIKAPPLPRVRSDDKEIALWDW